MSKRVNDNAISINGAKLKSLLESSTGKSLKELSLENGFSDSFLRMVVKTGKATPTAQAVIRLYGIEPSAYEIKPGVLLEAKPEIKTDGQLSIDDLLGDEAKGLLKDYIKEAVEEALIKTIFNGKFNVVVDTKNNCYRVVGKFNEPKTATSPDKWSV